MRWSSGSARCLSNGNGYLDWRKGWPVAAVVIEGAAGHPTKGKTDTPSGRWGIGGGRATLRLRALNVSDYWRYHLRDTNAFTTPNNTKAMSVERNQLTSKEPPPLGKATQAKRGIVRIDSLLSGDSPRLAGADRAHVRRLAETSGELPPIIVHRPTMRIIDGTHRVYAALLQGKEEIEAEFFDGSADEAFVQAVEHNIAHGLPLTMPERKLAAARIIASCPDLSDRVMRGPRDCQTRPSQVSGVRLRKIRGRTSGAAGTGEPTQSTATKVVDGQARP